MRPRGELATGADRVTRLSRKLPPEQRNALRQHFAQIHAQEQRGHFSEASVLDICSVLYGETAHRYLTAPPRLSTRQEDREGIDVVCPSTFGDLLLQVKSSFGGARKFLERKSRRSHVIEVVIAHPNDPLVTTRRVVAALSRCRARLREAYRARLPTR